MPVVAISCVKNEADIIEAFVRHTLALVDGLAIMENGSTDGTLETLRCLEREGLPLHIVEDASPGYWQLQRMTKLMREYAVGRLAADWIVPLDADEFLVTAENAPLFPMDQAEPRPLRFAWKTYVPDPLDNAAEANLVQRIRHRLVVEPRPWHKVVVPGRLAGHPGASLSQGNHDFQIDGVEVPPAPLDHAHLAHFPGRSPEQLLAKFAIGHFQYMAMHSKKSVWGYHYSAPFELIKHDPAAFAASFREQVLRYTLQPTESFEPQLVEDPIPYRGGSLRYLPPGQDRSGGLRAVFNFVEGLCEHYKEKDSQLAQIKERAAHDLQPLERAHLARMEQLEQTRNQEVRDLQTMHADMKQQLQERLESRDREVRDLQAIYSDMQQRLQELAQSHDREVHDLQNVHADMQQRLQELAENRDREVRELQKALIDLQASYTWHVGRAFVGPVGRLVRALKPQRTRSSRPAA